MNEGLAVGWTLVCAVCVRCVCALCVCAVCVRCVCARCVCAVCVHSVRTLCVSVSCVRGYARRCGCEWVCFVCGVRQWVCLHCDVCCGLCLQVGAFPEGEEERQAAQKRVHTIQRLLVYFLTSPVV